MIDEAALGEFASRVTSWRRLMALAPTLNLRRQMFDRAVRDIALSVERGLDRTLAADELIDMAQAHAFFGEDEAEIHERIGGVFARIKPNGKAGIEPAPELLTTVKVFPMDETTIAPRDWEVPGLFLHKHVTVFVAPSGSGKSLLCLQLALACAQGIEWAGWKPRKAYRVLIVNSEDDFEEIRRRLAAATHRMAIVDQTAVNNNLMIIESANDPKAAVIARLNPATKQMIATPQYNKLVATIEANNIDLIFVDPFAETFEGDENSNNDLKWAAAEWRSVARVTGAAVCLVHHTRKYAVGMQGDVDAARGAGALIGIARIVSTLFPMTAKEAEAMDIPRDDRPDYLRYDDAKANLNRISPFAKWFRKETIQLANGNGSDSPGDEVGVLVPWQFKVSITEEQIIELFKRIDRGVPAPDGTDSGEFYTGEKRGARNTRYVGPLVKEMLHLVDKDHADKLVKDWLATGPEKIARLKMRRYISKSAKGAKGGDRWRLISELHPDFHKPPEQAESADVLPFPQSATRFRVHEQNLDEYTRCVKCGEIGGVMRISDSRIPGCKSETLHMACAEGWFDARR